MKAVTPPTGDKRAVLLYGPPKTGKTAGATSAPGPVLLLNADLPNASWFAHSRRDDLIEVGYESFRETLVAIGKGIAAQDLTFGGTAPEPVATIVVDPVHEMYRRLLEELSDRAISPSLPTYQAVSVHLERFFRSLCEAPAPNVVFVAHDLPVKDEASGEVERLPATGTNNPALGRRLMGMVDVVGYTAVMEQEGGDYAYVAQLVNAKGRRGGDRFDALGPFREMDLTEWFAEPLKTEKTEEEAVPA